MCTKVGQMQTLMVRVVAAEMLTQGVEGPSLSKTEGGTVREMMDRIWSGMDHEGVSVSHAHLSGSGREGCKAMASVH